MNPGQKSCLQELKVILQIMALPVTGQLRVGADRAATAASLIQAFQQRHRAALATTGSEMMARQKNALLDLANVVGRLERSLPRLSWSDEALRRSPMWRQLRRSARLALAEFGWPLELPDDELPCGDSRNEASDRNRIYLELEQVLPEACQAAMQATIAQ